MNKRLLIIVLAVTILGSIGVAFQMTNVKSPIAERRYIYSRYRFRVEIDGIVQASFREVEGLNVTVDVWEYIEGSDTQATPQLEPGIARYGPLVLRYGATASMELWEWMEDTLNGEVDRKNLSVIILDYKGSEVARYNLINAWPSHWSIGKLKGYSSGPVIEELVIQYEGLDRVS